MPPASALQDRIRQFEAMNGGVPNRDRPRPSYPPVPRVQASFVSSETTSSSTDLLGDPVSPTAASYTIIKPTVPYVPRRPRIKSPSPSPPNLGCNTSLIDLGDSKLEERAEWFKVPKPRIAPPLPPRIPSQNSGTSGSTSSRSWSPHELAPSMALRTSSNSLTVDHTYPPLHKDSANSSARQRQGHVPGSSTSSFHSVSLSSDGDAGADGTSTDAGSSISSFIATYPMDRSNSTKTDTEKDRDSFDDSFSFETVSSSDMASPQLSSTHEWEKDFSLRSINPDTPKLPLRPTPLSKTTSSSNSSTSAISSPVPTSSLNSSPTMKAVRRVPPPPPPSRFNKPPPPSGSSRASVMSAGTTASDRSSLFSNGTGTTAHTSIGSCTQLLRPIPVPIIARKRYEGVFFANVNAQRRLATKSLSPTSSANSSSLTPPASATPRKGWRGVSVDLTTNPEENPVLSEPIEDMDGSRLNAKVVRVIWSRSKLTRGKLRDIWNECALPEQTSLDKDGFVKGMWRIDEELRRVQSMRSSTVTMTSNSRSSKWTTTGPLLH